MKLKYTYVLKTGARDLEYGPSRSRHLAFEGCEVEFLFEEDHRISGMAVYLPDVRLPRENGRLHVPAFTRQTVTAHALATFFVNLLYFQTGEGTILRSENSPRLIAETDEEAAFLDTYIVARFSAPIGWTTLEGQYDLRPETIDGWRRVKNPLTMYVDACRLTDPISKFREFYRVFEYFFPQSRGVFDHAVAAHLRVLDQRFTEAKVRRLRVLRDKCSHAKGKFITSAHWSALGRVREELSDLQSGALLLLRNAPRRPGAASS